MNESEMKAWIDGATMTELLRKWRFEPAGSPWFRDEVGRHFNYVMQERRRQDQGAYTAASKHIGLVPK